MTRRTTSLLLIQTASHFIQHRTQLVLHSSCTIHATLWPSKIPRILHGGCCNPSCTACCCKNQQPHSSLSAHLTVTRWASTPCHPSCRCYTAPGHVAHATRAFYDASHVHLLPNNSDSGAWQHCTHIRQQTTKSLTTPPITAGQAPRPQLLLLKVAAAVDSRRPTKCHHQQAKH